MFNGGQVYSKRAAQIIRSASLLIPLLSIFYGAILSFYASEQTRLPIQLIFLLGAGWIIVALGQFFFSHKSRTTLKIWLILYHLFAASFLIFVASSASPLAILWILLIIISYVYFGNEGAIWSALCFVAVIFADVSWWHLVQPEIAFLNFLNLIAVIISSLVILSFIKSQNVDQTELERLHRRGALEKNRILGLINNLTSAVLSLDKKGTIKLYNSASLSLLDTNDNLNGKSADKLLNLSDESGATVKLSQLLKTTTHVLQRDDLWLQLDENEKLRLSLTISPIKNAFDRNQRTSSESFILILDDITKQKNLEDERDEFISVVSHELRTPTAVVEASLSNINLLLSKDKLNKPILTKSVDLAYQQAVFLAKMINDLSTLSRAERGVGDQPELINLSELVAELFHTYQPQAKEKNLAFNVDVAAGVGFVKTSPLYLRELLQNFITNAIKYTKSGTVTLSLKLVENQVLFAVKDSGIGISKNEQDKVFKKFYRSEDYRTRETGGTGLGLYVSAKLAQKIGTQIELTSRLNHGSTFSFSLPAVDVKQTKKSA